MGLKSFFKSFYRDELVDLLAMEPKAKHLLLLLTLSTESMQALLLCKAAAKTKNMSQYSGPFNGQTDDWKPVKVNPDAYSESDIAWLQEVAQLKVAVAAKVKSESFAEAIPLLKQELRLAPGFDFALLALGLCYSRIGQQQNAIKVLERAKVLHPTHSLIATNLEAVIKETKNI